MKVKVAVLCTMATLLASLAGRVIYDTITEYDLMDFLASKHHLMKKEACYALSNLIAQGSLPIELILQQVFSFLLGNDTEVDLKEEALWCLCRLSA
jgi:hypothetical protein